MRHAHLIRDSHYFKDINWPERVHKYIDDAANSEDSIDLKLIERLGIRGAVNDVASKF